MKIVVINGVGGSGKDTFVHFVQDAYNQYPQRFTVGNISTVDFVKQIATDCGWTGVKEERDRKFLSDLKDLLEEYNNLPNRMVDRAIKHFEQTKVKVVFVHCREPKGIDYFVKKYGAITLLIHNPNIEPITSNHADANVADYDYEYIIENDGSLEDLRKKAIDFYNEIL